MLLAPSISSSSSSETRFFSKYAALLDILQRVGDLVIVVATAWAIYALRFHTASIGEPYRSGIILAVLLAAIIFPSCNIYRSWRGESLIMEILRVWLAWTAVFVGMFVLTWIMKSTGHYSRLWVAGWFAGGLVLFALNRFAARRLLGAIRAHGIDTRKVVLVGATHSGKKIVEAARNNPWMGLEVIGYVETPYDQVAIGSLPRLGNIDEFVTTTAAANRYEQLWIALPMRAEEDIRRVTAAVNETSATIRLIPDLFGYELLNQQTTELAGIPVITLCGSRIVGHARIIKAVEDRVLSALILVLISPVMLLLAIGVKLSSPGPVFFRQKRHGLNGKEVEVWKFRSMRVHQETAGVVTQATRGDPRVTRFGRLIRRTSLDELPQFINVLRGDMSIVGPRPHALEHDSYYRSLVDNYTLRNHVKPGITGLAQISGFRGETETIDKMVRRIQYDLLYICNWTVWLDIKIIIKTTITGFLGRNAY